MEEIRRKKKEEEEEEENWAKEMILKSILKSQKLVALNPSTQEAETGSLI